MVSARKPTKTAIKKAAQELIMDKIASVGYGEAYSDFIEDSEDKKMAEKILKEQMDRVAKMFGFKEAWFY